MRLQTLSSRDNTETTNEEEISIISKKVSPQIIRTFPRGRPWKARGRKCGRSNIQTETLQKKETENQNAKKSGENNCEGDCKDKVVHC
jgi:hypothetical protein